MSSILNATTSSGLVTSADNSGSLQLATNNGTTALTIDTSQNVGIGTASPETKLHVTQSNDALPTLQLRHGDGDFILMEEGGGTDLFKFTRVAGTNDLQINNVTANNIRIATNNTERMRITSSGSVGIGTTIPGTRLHVVNTNSIARFVATESTAGTEVIIQSNLINSNNATSSDYFFIGGIDGGSDRVYILGNGNLQNLNGSYGTISDASLKENIIDATPKLDKVMQLKVRNFNFIDNELKQIGFVAQELETIFPGLIEESQNLDRDGKRTGTTRKAVKTTVLIPILVKAMQEQQAAIQELKAELDATKAEVTALKGAA